jgi:ArsR family transcriptional regulator
MMLKAGLLNQCKDGLKIFYSLRHPEVLELVELAELIAGREAAIRADLFGRKEP